MTTGRINQVAAAGTRAGRQLDKTRESRPLVHSLRICNIQPSADGRVANPPIRLTPTGYDNAPFRAREIRGTEAV